MSLFTKQANDVFAAYNADGSSRAVDNQEAQVWGTEVERVITAFTSSGSRLFTSLANLNGQLGYPATTMAWVIGDPIVENNGIYQKNGAEGTGGWTRRADLPFSFIVASDSGAGTPNAIQATTSIPVSGSALVWLNVYEANTGPVTVSFNGGTPLAIKTNTGGDINPGGLAAGMVVLGIVTDSTFRLVSDQASASIVAAAEAAADRAEAAAGNAGAGFYFPELFGALHDGSDDKAAIEACCAAAVAGGGTVHFAAGRTYSFSSLVIPAGTNVRMRGAAWRYLGTLAGSGNIPIIIQDDCTFDDLTITSPGTEANITTIQLGERVVIEGTFDIAADVQKGGTAVMSTGQMVWIGRLRSDKYDRPLHFNNFGNPSVTVGSYVGFMEVESYVRAFAAENCDWWTLGGFSFRTRSLNAGLNPGHNGIIITGCQHWSVGDGYIGNSGEHAFRVSGTTRASSDARIGFLTVEKSGGCALKINPSSASRAKNIACAGVWGIDVGELSGSPGDNREIVRLSHYDNIRIAQIIADVKDEPDSGQYTIVVNDGTELRIGSIGGGSANASLRINKDSDVDGVTNLPGPVSGVYIDNYSATINGFGSGINVQMDGQGFGDVYINANGVKGWTTNYVTFAGTPTITGPVEFTGYVGGAVAPIFAGAPADARVRADVSWNSRRYRGQCSLFDNAYNGEQVVASAGVSAGNAKGSQTLINNAGLAAGNGNNGGGIEFTRLGSARRGAAFFLRQTGANVYNTGFVWLVGGDTEATDALTPGMTLDHAGNLAISGAISKGSGTFKIDHPLDPEGKDLIHGFIEGPRYDLIYRGRVKLHQGRAIVDIDVASAMTRGTFAALTQMAEVISLSNRSGFARVRAGEVFDGTFEVICEDDASTDEIAWMVMAERADPFIVQNDPWTDRATGRLIPEHTKPDGAGLR